MKIIDLNGKYNMFNLADDFFYCEANIPGSDLGNLVKCGFMPLNDVYDELENYTIVHSDMVFERSFCLDDIGFEHIVLHCEQLDTLSEVYVNGKRVAKTENAHISYDFDVKQYVKTGENTLKFVLLSPVDYILARQKDHPLPKNANGIDGAAYLRKPSCHFGWDWGPCVPYKYIGNVELQCFNQKIVVDSIEQKHYPDRVIVNVCAENADEIVMISPDGKSITSDGRSFVIENPMLWYTRDLNEKAEQPLYTVVLKNSEMTVEQKIGLRTVELNRERDAFGSNFQFMINGKRIFAKGANLIPFSAIPEQADKSTVDNYLDLAVKSNFNMIRVWGGGTYASEYLLEQCDRLGILIWQDFCYACLMYPFYERDFLDNALNEAKLNVKRMTLHPSVALWCGNNEIEAMFNYLPKSSRIIKAYIDFFYHRLPEAIDP